MTRLHFVILTLLFFTGSLLGVLEMTNKTNAESKPVQPDYSTWLWDSSKIVSEKETLLTFLAKKRVNHLYLQIDTNRDKKDYKKFIAEAAKSGIHVYALDGAPDWGDSSKELNTFLKWIAAYQRDANPKEQFAGIHLDIEPYFTHEWNADYKNAVLKYQGALLTAEKMAKSLNITFAADIPFWFDSMSFHNNYGKGNLDEWVIKHTDEVTIMAYRDKASGPNGIIELVQFEMKAAEREKKNITIAVETMDLGDDHSLTFFEEGQATMERELSLILEYYQHYPSFKGFAVHHAFSWLTLKE